MPTLYKLFYKRDDALLLRTVLQKTQKPLRTHCQIKTVSELRMPLLCPFHMAQNVSAPVPEALYLGALGQSNNIQCCIAAMRILQGSHLRQSQFGNSW